MLIFGFMLFGNTCFVDKDGVSSSSGSNSYCPGRYVMFNFVFLYLVKSYGVNEIVDIVQY